MLRRRRVRSRGGDWGNFTALAGRNAAALDACIAPYATPWWATPVVLTVVFVLAGLLCWIMPWWRIRRRGLQRIADNYPAGFELRYVASDSASMERDSSLTGVRHRGSPWHSATRAVPGYRCPGACSPCGRAKETRFRATILHELAHLHNRDVGITYATVSVWRVFGFAVLLPYLAEQASPAGCRSAGPHS